MSTSPILGLPQVAPNQNNKETTINTAFSTLERSLNDIVVISLASSSVTLSLDDFRRHQVFRCTGHTEARNLTVPNQKRFFAAHNTGSEDVTVRTASPTTTTVVPPSSYVIMFSDGNNNILKIADSAAAASSPTFIGQTDTPSSYTGHALKVVRVNSGATGLEFHAMDLAMEDLADVDGYTNGFYARVKSDGSGIEWVAANPGGETEFVNLNDVPNDYSGQANRVVTVNSSEDGLQFVPRNNLLSFLQLTDAPTTYSSANGNAVAVNPSGTGLEFIPFPSFGNKITLSPDDPNEGFESGFFEPWFVVNFDFLDALAVTDDYEGLLADEGDYFLSVVSEELEQVEAVRLFYLTEMAPNAQLDNSARLTLEYAWTRLADLPVEGEIEIRAETAGSVLIDSTTISSLAGTVKSWQSGVFNYGLPLGTRQVRLILRVTNTDEAEELAFAWDKVFIRLTVTQPVSFIDLPDTPDEYDGNGGRVLRVNTAEDAVEFVVLPFTSLSGVPSSYSGQAGNLLQVNVGETGLQFVEFIDLLPPIASGDAGKALVVNGTEDGLVWSSSGSGASSFTDLDDTPANYTGHANKMVVVNGTADGLAFSDPPTPGAINFTELTDTPANYTGHGGKLVRVNSGATAVEFVEDTAVSEVTASRDLTNTDFSGGRVLLVNSGSAVTLDIPSGLSRSSAVVIVRQGTGAVNVTAGSGVTLNSADGNTALRVRYSSASLIPVGTNSYILVGDLA